jgi:inositol-phosphate transport system substrate-binding protein
MRIHFIDVVKPLAFAAAVLGLVGPSATVPANAEEVTLNVWSRQDRSGPLRGANLVRAAVDLNKALKKEGSDTSVVVVVRQGPAPGFDDDALQLLKVFGIGEGPDLFVAAHEWTCAFANEGFALNLEPYIDKYPEHFGTIFPSLWESTKCKGQRYAVPQDAEARMFFYNKKLMREAGIDSATIDGLPDRVLAGEVTLDDISGIAKQVVEKSQAEWGILHRPSVGPDYIMVFHSYGNDFVDAESGEMLLEPAKLEAAYGWFDRNVKNGVTPPNNTAMEWDNIRAAFYADNKAAFWMYGIWDLGSNAFPSFGVPSEEMAFFKDWGWTAAPPVKKGGEPGSLTHPIVYVVSGKTKHPDLAVRLVGFASSADLNTDHAVTTTHIGINKSQADDPRYQAAWPLLRATELLPFTKFMPNHPDFGPLNLIVYKGLQGVEQGRLTAAEAAAFVIDEAQGQLENVIVK